MSCHLWLLHRGGPQPAQTLAERARAWWSALLDRLWPRHRLPGPPDPLLAMAETQARLLRRVLGDGWRCKAVFRTDGPGVEEAAAAVGQGDTVVVISALPQHSALNEALYGWAEAALTGRRVRVVRAATDSVHPGLIEALAESVRAALVDNQINSYTVLFYAPALAGSGPEVEATRDAVVQALGLRAPHALGWLSAPGARAPLGPSLQAVLSKTGEAAALLVPLAPTLPWFDQGAILAGLRARPDQRIINAASIATSPTLVRALADQARSLSGQPALAPLEASPDRPEVV